MKRILIAFALLCLPVCAQAQQLFVQQPNFYKNITSGTTTVVDAKQGKLHAIVVGNAGSTVTATLYDNATAGSGTKLGTITLVAGATYTFDVSFAAGLTIVTSGTCDITVSFR
jgi:hypothetical protein